jgi:hypothetical protein
LEGIGWRNWEVTFFEACFVTQVGTFLSTGVPTTFYRVYMIVAFVGGLVVADIIKDEEFSFWTEKGCVTESCGS